jgi:predicted NBD/HSP70 family sugar kinase
MDIKRKNLKSVIDHIRFQESCHKKDVARDLNLSFATISNMVNFLMTIGAAKEVQISGKTVGRLPKGFALIPDRFIIVTIDICNEETVILRAVDLSRQIVKVETYNLVMYGSLDRYIAQMKDIYSEFVEPFQDVIGASLIAPSTLDYSHGIIIGSRIRIFHKSEVRKRLEEALAIPVFIGNDTDLAAYFRAREIGIRSLVYIYFDLQGLGIGIVSNGNILMSVSGYSPEISHVPFGRLEHTCKYCGQKNCLQEDLMHLGFLTKYYGHVVELTEYTQGMWDAYVEAVRRQDPRAIEIANENALLLSRVLSVVCGLFRPELPMIGGLEKPLFDIISKVVDENINARDILNAPMRVECDADYHKATALGAAEYVYSNWMPDIEQLAAGR